MAKLDFFARVLKEYARIGWVRKSQFRLEYFNQVVMDSLYYLSFLLTFHILYGFREGLTLAGWTREDMLVFLGVSFVTDAFMMMWLGQAWHFGEDLKAGNLDAFRLRPGPVWFTYTFQRFSPEGLTNFAVASSILGYAMVRHSSVGLADAALLPWGLAVAFVAQTALHILFCALEFWAVNADLARFFQGIASQVGDRPIDIYPLYVKRFMTWVVPIAALAWFPAGLVVGHVGWRTGLAATAVVLAFAAAVMRMYARGMRRYESAMS